MSSPASSSFRNLRLALLALAAAVAGLVVASLVLKPQAPAKVTLDSGTLLDAGRPIPEFSLTGDDGQPFTRAALTGGWSLIFVGFTHCPDICPNTLGLLKTVHGQLDAAKKPLRVVLLSVDPERDTPELLARYVKYFDPSFKGATGPTAQLDALGSALGYVYIKRPAPPPAGYTLDHSAALILVNPDAQVIGYFTPPLKIDALVADLARLIPAQT